MDLIHITYQDDIAIIELNRGITNALNGQLIQTLAEQVRGIRDDAQIQSLVLTSANDKFFSIGLDIPGLYELNPAGFGAFYESFVLTALELYTLPKPTIAAITGHAIAGGCILTLCCDHRLIAQGRKLMALNEVKLGVPVPYLAECVLRQIAGPRNAQEIMDTGEFYAPETLLHLGMVDEVLPLAQVRSKAIEMARSLGKLPAGSFEMGKQNRVGPIAAEVRARLEEKLALFVQQWYSDEARELLREAIEKF